MGERLAADTSLAGWLHRGTRYAALNHLRDNRRRLTNERQAMNQLLTNAEPSADWEQIRPALDEALDSLDDEDREALLLRYFKNQDFRAVGHALGVSEDAAQKRVSRAVERLREFFSKQNATIGAGGLVVLISANAVQAAPVGLAATISAAAVLAGSAVHTSTIIAATKMIAMTTLQKTLVTATVAVLAGAGIYEAHQASQLRDQVQTLQQQQTPLAERLRQLQQERDDATNQLAGLLAENVRLKSNSKENELLKLRGEVARLKNTKAQTENDPMEIAAKTWLTKVNLLKQRLEQTPNEQIPELRFATETDWLNAALGTPQLKTDADYRWDLHNLFSEVEGTFGEMAWNALRQYIQANNGQFPTDLSQLQPYFNTPVDNSILERYEIVPANTILKANEMSDSWLIVQKNRVDENDKNDGREVIGPKGYGNSWTFW